MKSYIYGLKDPITDKVVYVGQSRFLPEKRLKQHYWKLNEVKRGERPWTKLFHYLDDLLPNKPIPFLIKELDNSKSVYSNPDWYEKYYIKKYNNEGNILLNTTEGGVGGYTNKFKTKEEKDKTGRIISFKLKGKPKPEGFGKHLSKMRKGKNNPMCKPFDEKIACFTKDGKFIKLFDYSFEIDEFIGKTGAYSNIKRQIDIPNRFPYGYMWKYIEKLKI